MEQNKAINAECMSLDKISKQRRTIDRIVFWIFIIIVVFCFFHLEQFIDATIFGLLDSDDASELILSRLLFGENRIITMNWYYSTELRVLNTQLIFTPLFGVFKDWHAIRIIGTAILHGLLLGSAWFLCCKIKCTRYFPFMGLMLLTPFSMQYYLLVLCKPYYIPHISITYVAVGLAIAYVDESVQRKKRIIVSLLSLLLAVVSCLGGARQVLCCYVPLFLAAVFLAAKQFSNIGTFWLNRHSSYWLFFEISTLCLCGAAIGYLTNTRILSKYYHFQVFELSFTELKLENMFNILRGFLSSLGYIKGAIMLPMILHNGACFFILLAVIVSTVCGLKKPINSRGASIEYQILAAVFSLSIVVFCLIYTLTNLDYAPRYNLPFLPLAIPLIMAGISSIGENKQLVTKGTTQARTNGTEKQCYMQHHSTVLKQVCIIGWVLSVYILGLYVFSYREEWKNENNMERKEIADILVAGEYYYGYATQWNANIFTEYSNGLIDMHDWIDGSVSEVKTVDMSNKWLQPLSHDTVIPEGKVFLLYGKGELDQVVWKDNLLDEDVVVKSDNFIVYGFNSYDEMKMKIQDGV